MGFLRFGQRIISLDYMNTPMQILVNCIVDMYVYYLCQRQGIGKMLIDRMLRFSEFNAENFSLFLPTKELLRFFHKNYMIYDYIKINDNYFISRKMVKINLI
jgi:hypothetical protein